MNQKALVSTLRRRYSVIMFNHKYTDQYVEYLMKKYNILSTTVMRYINNSKELINATEFDLFVLTDGLDELDKTKLIKTFFSEEEIKYYKKRKYEREKFKFPIIIPCIPVRNDQWIGAVDASFFMKLRDSQMIRYNPEAQRVMKKVTRRKGGLETYTIAVNNKAVEEIKESMRSDSYISDEITLNIPEDMDCKMEYVDGELIINKLDYFDISDGYHRYLAMGQLYDEDHEFNYPMEIRIIRYSNNKVKRFIYQKDQKTKMSKIDSSSMNMDSFSNIIAEQLNTEYSAGEFVLHKKINRTGGTINLPELSQIINYFYTPANNRQKKYSLKEITSIRNEIKDGLNEFFIEVYPKDIEESDEHIDYRNLLIIMYAIKMNLINTMNKKELYKKYISCSEYLHSEECKKYFKTRTPKLSQVNIIKEMFEQ